MGNPWIAWIDGATHEYLSAAGATEGGSKAMAVLRDAINAAWKLEQLSVALAVAPAALVRSLRAQRTEREIDRTLGIRTSVRSFVAPPSRFSDAAPSQPLGYAALRCIERDILARGMPLKSLIDLGCGRGRALAYLSKLPFETMVGVEVDAEVAGAARENFRALAGGLRHAIAPTVIDADAADVELRWAGAVLLFFNPFGPQTLRAVLTKVRASLAEAPVGVLAYYAVPLHHRVFREVFPAATVNALDCQETAVYRYQLPSWAT